MRRATAAVAACVFGCVVIVMGSSSVGIGTQRTATEQADVQPASAAPTTGLSTSAPSTSAPSTTAPSTSAPSTTAPSTSVPRRESIVLGFAGDSTFTNGLHTREPFAGVTDLLRSYDFMMINLETAVADSDVGAPPVPKRFLFRSPPESLDLVVDAGIDAVALGNNHTRDFGIDAVAQTLEELDARSIGRTGGGLTEDESYEPLLVNVGGWALAIHSFSRVPCDWSASGDNVRPETAWACPTLLDRADLAIAEAAQAADISIVLVHGGEEGVLCPSAFMLELEQHWASLGVDVVIGGHPHVVQGVAMLGDTLVAHSTGNFAFPPANGISANSVVVEVVISANEDRADEADIAMRMQPVRAEGGVLRVGSPAEEQAIRDQISNHSTGALLDESGWVTSAPDHRGAC